MINIDEILTLLPHRYPFVLIDRILALVPGEYVVALKNVTINEPFFQGHFPETPVMPGVLMLEAMAQTAAVLAIKTREALTGLTRQKRELYYFAGVNHARFKRPVIPGDQIQIRAALGKVKRSIFTSEVIATVNDEVVCTAELMAAMKEVNL